VKLDSRFPYLSRSYLPRYPSLCDPPLPPKQLNEFMRLPASSTSRGRTDLHGSFGLANELLLCIHIAMARPGIATKRETAADHLLLGQSPGPRSGGRWNGSGTDSVYERDVSPTDGSMSRRRRSPGRPACLLGLPGYLGWATRGHPARSDIRVSLGAIKAYLKQEASRQAERVGDGSRSEIPRSDGWRRVMDGGLTGGSTCG